eukprot:CAMPEP_0172668716 /NCGR_PEP_ID=MMETSP1074-20121228/9233_1 /TAXON_ID=2916 /ORGANISM="Ceratium fusus, Strain PA161109" /LENGTH=218 /DNA_ID=CAMNT_0013485397 /DNA_START=104 /DNA_END=760 /DNA_ORIENTATION=+
MSGAMYGTPYTACAQPAVAGGHQFVHTAVPGPGGYQMVAAPGTLPAACVTSQGALHVQPLPLGSVATWQQPPAVATQTFVAPHVPAPRPVIISAASEAAHAAATTSASASDTAFVESKISQPGVLVFFSKTYCPFVIKAKEILANLRPRPVMDVIELDVLGQPRHGPMQQALRAKTGSSTVPQAFVNGTYIGGCQELSSLHSAGQLMAKLQQLGCRFS